MGKIKELILTAKEMCKRGELTLFEADKLHQDYGIIFHINGGNIVMDCEVQKNE